MGLSFYEQQAIRDRARGLREVELQSADQPELGEDSCYQMIKEAMNSQELREVLESLMRAWSQIYSGKYEGETNVSFEYTKTLPGEQPFAANESVDTQLQDGGVIILSSGMFGLPDLAIQFRT